MSDRLLKESDVLKAIDKRIEELSKHPEFVRKNGIIDIVRIKKYILAIPSVERPKGKWIDYRPYNIPLFDCSICGYHAKKMSNFCPNCGAYMRGVDDE